jgi:hypothetical protein
MTAHAFSGIRTCDPSNQADADLRLRPHGNRPCSFLLTYFVLLTAVSSSKATCNDEMCGIWYCIVASCLEYFGLKTHSIVNPLLPESSRDICYSLQANSVPALFQ